MQSSFSRFCYWAGAIIGALYAVHNFFVVFAVARVNGFDYIISTTYYSKSGRWDYVRPVFEDLLFAAGLLLASVIVGCVVAYASRGVSDWEELLDTGSSRQGNSRY